MNAELNAVDRATLGVWRALHAWMWGFVAFVAAVALHVAFNSLVMVAPSGYASRPALPWQFAIRVGGTVVIGLVIGWIVAWRVERRPWLTATVVGVFYTLVALGLVDRLFALPASSTVEVTHEGDITSVSVGTGLAGGAASIFYAACTAATALIAGAVSWRRSRSD